MKINQYALDAIRDAELTGENIAGLFEKMANAVDAVTAPGGLLVLNYMDPNNLPAEGEFVPTITLGLKPFTLRPPEPEARPTGKEEQ